MSYKGMICRDGRIFGQTNKGSSSHLGVLEVKKPNKGHNPNSKGRPFLKGFTPWNKGMGTPPEYNGTFNSKFKELIRERDSWKCQLCGCPETECIRKLDIHHIDYNKKNDSPLNLVSLCTGCHTKTTHKREYYKKYFSKERNNNGC